MLEEHVLQNYAYHRARGMKAADALNLARDEIAKGLRRYGACSRAIYYNPKSTRGNYRWIENAGRGLRLVGFADEIYRGIDHKGWYTREDDMDETLRGIVYQLPARHGVEQYVHGYADPCNEGAAYLCFDLDDDKEQAARNADRVAEIFAEEQRDYNAAWDAGNRATELEREAAEQRAHILSLREEIKDARAVSRDTMPTICATLRAEIVGAYHKIQKLRKERDHLRDDYGRSEGFEEAYNS